MARHEVRKLQVPKYVLEWVGKRVTWYDYPHHRAGLVLEARDTVVDHHDVVLLRIARDDGFIAIGVDARQCTKEGKP